MDNKKKKRHEQMDKKIITVKVEDGGDLKTVTKNDSRKKDNTTNGAFAGGDSRKISSFQRSEKSKLNVINEYKAKPKLILEAEKEQLCSRPAYLKRVRDRYTTRLNSHTTNLPTNALKKEDTNTFTAKIEHVPTKDNVKNVSTGDNTKKSEDVTQIKDKEKDLSDNSTKESLKEPKKAKKEPNTQRKRPIIKTIMTRNDTTRVYKAVTFGEQRQKPTPLQIKIPNETAQKNVSRTTDVSSLKNKLTVSKISVHEEIEGVGKKRLRHRDKKYKSTPSREGSYRSRSPPTEVARWAPSSVDKHTKPYYEAWVNTTFAAISKKRNREKFQNDEKLILQTLRNALQRPMSPELIYSNYNDERYTGRIKITQR